jgi:hypothetical protein
MLQGIGINDTIQALIREGERKHDTVIPVDKTEHLTVSLPDADGEFDINLPPSYDDTGARTHDGGAYDMSDTAMAQLAHRLHIRQDYLTRIRETMPDVFKHTIDRHFEEHDRGFFTRTFEPNEDNPKGMLRALLSPAYKVIDHLGLLMGSSNEAEQVEDRPKTSVLHALADMNANVVAAQITPDKLFLKAVTPFKVDINQKPPNAPSGWQSPEGGDHVRGGCMITNSETGRGGFHVNFYVERLICTNGMVATSKSFEAISQRHVGGVVDADRVQTFVRNETQEKIAEALSMTAVDAVRGMLSKEHLEIAAQQFRDGKEITFGGSNERDAENVVDATREKYNMTIEEGKRVYERLFTNRPSTQSDFNLFDLTNAITQVAHVNMTDFTRSTEFETIGGQVLAAAALPAAS